MNDMDGEVVQRRGEGEAKERKGEETIECASSKREARDDKVDLRIGPKVIVLTLALA